MTAYTYEDAWRTVKELPTRTRMRLAEAIMTSIRKQAASEDDSHPFDPEPLYDFMESELRALTVAVLSPERQERLRQIPNPAPPEDEAEVVAILGEIDEITLLRARAWYTLKLRGLETNESIHQKISA